MPAPRHYRIDELIPHGAGFRLIDHVVAYDEETVTCEVAIRPDSMFAVDRRAVPSWVGIEYMAQTISAYMGLRRLQAGKKIQVGLLLGTRVYECTRPEFAVGTTLRVSTSLLVRGNDGVGAFSCEMRDGGECIATAEIKAFDPDDSTAFLQQLREQARAQREAHP